MARRTNKKHSEKRATKRPGGTSLSPTEAKKYASIYATPEEMAQAKLYGATTSLRQRASQTGKAVPAKQGAPLLLSKYDPTRPEVQLPEGPLLPPRTYRPHGAFYSREADKLALSKVGKPNKNKLDSKDYEHRRAHLDVADKAKEQALKAAKINASIYATPKEHADNRLYSISTINRHRAGLAKAPKPPLQGAALDVPKYNALRGFVKPEGPLTAPRKNRPHGSFYSQEADDKAFEIARRGADMSTQFTRIPETGVGSEWLAETKTSVTPANFTVKYNA